jgi:hypothetical protein
VMGYHFGWAFCLALIGRNAGIVVGLDYILWV